jgi:hypothetical protein
MPAPASGTSSYLLTLQDLLELRDWRIVVMDEPADEGLVAYITPVPGQKVAYLELAPDFADGPPEMRRHTLVHELLHCHFHEMQAIVDRSAPLVGQIAGPILSGEHRNFLEHAVDAVATAIAPHLPLPTEDPA